MSASSLDVLRDAGIAVVALAVSWFIGRAFARWGRGPALFLRVLACGPIGVVALVVALHGFGGRHGMPIEVLYVPAALYPLIASETDRAIGLRVLVLGELAAAAVSQAVTVARWWDGIGSPDAIGIVALAAMAVGVPLAALWAQVRDDQRRGPSWRS